MSRHGIVLPTLVRGRVSIHPSHSQTVAVETALRAAGVPEQQIARILAKDHMKASFSELWAQYHDVDPHSVQDVEFTVTLSGEPPSNPTEILKNASKTLSGLINLLKDERLGLSASEKELPLSSLLALLKLKTVQSLAAKFSTVRPPKLPTFRP